MEANNNGSIMALLSPRPNYRLVPIDSVHALIQIFFWGGGGGSHRTLTCLIISDFSGCWQFTRKANVLITKRSPHLEPLHLILSKINLYIYIFNLLFSFILFYFLLFMLNLFFIFTFVVNKCCFRS